MFPNFPLSTRFSRMGSEKGRTKQGSRIGSSQLLLLCLLASLTRSGQCVWRGVRPQMGVISHTFTISRASSSGIIRWPSESTLLSLCSRASRAVVEIPAQRAANASDFIRDDCFAVARTSQHNTALAFTARYRFGRGANEQGIIDRLRAERAKSGRRGRVQSAEFDFSCTRSRHGRNRSRSVTGARIGRTNSGCQGCRSKLLT